jgi:hypothetical protein
MHPNLGDIRPEAKGLGKVVCSIERNPKHAFGTSPSTVL